MMKAWPKEEITFKNYINHLSGLFPSYEYILYVMEFSVGLPYWEKIDSDISYRQDRCECHH